MKKNLTKLLALMMALALVFSLAACGDKTGDESSTDPSNNPAVANSDNEGTLDAADPSAESSSENVSNDVSESGNDVDTPSENVTTPDSKMSTKANDKPNTDTGLNTTDKAQVVKAYQDAAKNSPNVKRIQTLALTQVNLGEGEGSSDTLMKIANGIIDKNNNIESKGLPGNYGALTASDLSSASATTSNGVTTLTMKIKDQTDYAQGHPGSSKKDAWGAGPCGHAIGVLGPVDDIVAQFTGKVDDNKDIEVKYTNAKITVTIKNGKITSGTMGYTAKIKATGVKVLKFIPISATGTITYKYTLKG